MIKLIVTNVDSTLLDSNSIITSLNKKAILECLKEGIEVILANFKIL